MALRDHIEYAAVAGLLSITRIMPRFMVYGLFKNIGLLMYTFGKKRRCITLTNLKIAFPELTEKERREIARSSYRNMAESLAENNLVMTGRITNEEILEMVETEGWDEFQQHKAAHDTGMLMITGHMGNWELMSQYLTLSLKEKVYVVARKGDNPLLEEKIVTPHRNRFGMNVFYKKNALIHIVKSVNKGHICGLLLDQKLNPPAGFPCSFFGRNAPTGGSPALLQLRFGIPIQPVFMAKVGPHKHRIILPSPVPWKDNGKPMEEQVKELTALHQAELEKIIRRYPDQWLWMHNRWGLKKEEREALSKGQV